MFLLILLFLVLIPTVQSLEPSEPLNEEDRKQLYTSPKFNIYEGYPTDGVDLCEFETTLCTQYYSTSEQFKFLINRTPPKYAPHALQQFGFIFESQPKTNKINYNIVTDLKLTDFNQTSLTTSTITYLVNVLNRNTDIGNSPAKKCYTLGLTSWNLSIQGYGTNLHSASCAYFKDKIIDISDLYNSIQDEVSRNTPFIWTTEQAWGMIGLFLFVGFIACIFQASWS